ncbi:hypothetical protein [Rubinisphaera margarita]|uniref:hypothetical protein n=1 Tax=Rubinisphaera margarita TaxID=2909586 RepID=UPI001EE924DD|nr:hypothetical protein [Rubinisphaera margarita]MCG6155978.1 hypothetical protein [Rubinisphaera margarita]
MKLFRLFPVLFVLSLAMPSGVQAQSNEGFVQNVAPSTQGNERSRQKSLWVMEVDMKPLRVIWVDQPNPQTGQMERQLYLYLCYRAMNRPVPAPTVRETEPQNRIDPEPNPPYFIPEFTLVATDTDERQILHDQILPEVQAAINAKERRTYKNSVTIVQPVPEATEEAPNNSNALFGVAIFSGIDPGVDRYTLYMGGFSNGYRAVPGPDGQLQLERKTIQQKFWRPGDEFDPNSLEFRFDEEPTWVYRPDDVTTSDE